MNGGTRDGERRRTATAVQRNCRAGDGIPIREQERGRGPWALLPRSFAQLIRAENVRLAPEIVRAIRRSIPEYAQPLEGRFALGIQTGAARSLAQFAEHLADSEAPTESSLQVYRALGRGEWYEGRSLDALQAAYRLGARLAWQRYTHVARRAGLPPEAMAVLAEAIFEHMDEMAAGSVAGYQEARAEAAGSLRQHRQRLLELLLDGAAEPVLAEAAQAARWQPQKIAAVALVDPQGGRPQDGAGSPDHPAATRRPVSRALPPEVLGQPDGPVPYLFLPDPDDEGAVARLGQALSGYAAVVGPAVPLAQAAQSLRWARTVAARLPHPASPGLVRCDRDLTSVLLLGDQDLLTLLAERRLAPLAQLTAKCRQRLEETLLAWLQTRRGSAPEVAARLGLHPQTVRQRMRRIEELFGDVLEDADARFEIEVVLRDRRLRSQGPSAEAPAEPN
jgi:DNA-binding CsgD family transcriptional regulator